MEVVEGKYLHLDRPPRSNSGRWRDARGATGEGESRKRGGQATDHLAGSGCGSAKSVFK